MKQISGFSTVMKREFLAYFNSPIAYIFAIVFLLITCGLYMMHFFLIGSADMRHFFSLLPIILCVFLPAVTMRSWAEEKRGNTLELLLTFPMNTQALVLGKFVAAFLFYAFALAGTFFIPFMLFMVGNPDVGPIIGGYLGALFLGAFFLSAGLFISGLCRDQIVAFILSMVLCFFLFLSGLDPIASVIDGWVPGLGSFLRNNFGMTGHFAGFEKGVVDNRDVFYFLVGTVLFLILNGQSMEDRLRPRAKVYFSGAVAACFGIVLLSNALLSGFSVGRFDLTENKIYTVTEATKRILSELKSPVTVKYYVSPRDKLPTALKTLEQDVRDKLDELEVVSGGKLRYRVFHLEPTNLQAAEAQDEEKSLEDELETRGIAPFQVQSIEEDEMGIKLVYSAMAIAYKEHEEEVLSRVVPDTLYNFEYEVISRIFRMTLDRKPKVVLVAPYQERAVDPQMLAFLKQLGQGVPNQYLEDDFSILESVLRYEDYDYARIRLTQEEPIPEGTETVVVMKPESLNDRQRYELSRFLAQGGNVLIGSQRYEFDYNAQARRGVAITPREIDSGLDAWFDPYGVTIQEDLLMDENAEVLSVAGGSSFGPFAMSVPIKAPTHILVTHEGMNQEVSITSQLSPLFYLWGSALEIDDEKLSELGLKKTVLLSSSDRSWLLPYQPGPLRPQDLVFPSGVGEASFPLAVMVEGTFPYTPPSEGPPPWDSNAESAGEQEAELPIDLQPGKLIVVGCSKMFEKDFVKSGGMIPFFINSIDAVTLGGELIDVRGQRPINRAVGKIEKMKKLWYRFLSVLSVPLFLVAIGVFRYVRRKKEKENYMRSLKLGGGRA